MTARPQPRVSIVTAVYNEEKHIAECIESVLAQTYRNWEYIIVNNCSTDRTLDIAAGYAARDPRIRVRSNDTFVGVQANHNIALREIAADSKYCKVVAADDYIFPECLERMVDVAERHPSVGIVGAYRLAGTHLIAEGLPFPVACDSGRAVGRAYLLDQVYLFGVPSSLLYRADIVRSRPMFFEEAHLHADVKACLETLQQHDFGFVHQILAFERIRDTSLHAFIKDNNLYIYERLQCLGRYGEHYLTAAELARATRKELGQYYEYLASHVYSRKDPKFWQVHRTRLAELGYPLSRMRLWVYGLCYGAEKVSRRLRRRLYGAPLT